MSITTNGKTGTLYVVATPIGHLDDISARAITTLQEVDLILAEDTRHSGRLLQHFSIQTPVQSCHEHNEQEQIPPVIERLKKGENIALITDAGTPLISDPGYRIVAGAHAAGIRVSPVPGPSALTAALSSAGIATDCFTFVGYLPAKAAARQERLQALVMLKQTLVIYEAPHRITGTLADLLNVFGGRREISLCRELTKRFETLRTGPLAAIVEFIQNDPDQQKGEFVLVIAGAPEMATNDVEMRRVLRILLKTVPVKAAAAIAAEILGESKNRLYRLALQLKDK